MRHPNIDSYNTIFREFFKINCSNIMFAKSRFLDRNNLFACLTLSFVYTSSGTFLEAYASLVLALSVTPSSIFCLSVFCVSVTLFQILHFVQFSQVLSNSFMSFQVLSSRSKSFQVPLSTSKSFRALPTSIKPFHILPSPFESFLVPPITFKFFQVFPSPPKSLHINSKEVLDDWCMIVWNKNICKFLRSPVMLYAIIRCHVMLFDCFWFLIAPLNCYQNSNPFCCKANLWELKIHDFRAWMTLVPGSKT